MLILAHAHTSLILSCYCCLPQSSAHNTEIVQLVDAGADVNEVEAAGNTPLHSAAFEGWLEGAQLLLQLGAKVNASNNAGDTPWVSGARRGLVGLQLLSAKQGNRPWQGAAAATVSCKLLRGFALRFRFAAAVGCCCCCWLLLLLGPVLGASFV